MTEPTPAPTGAIGRSLAAVAMGAFIVLLGFVASVAQGMVTAPSHRAALVALGLMAAGALLALLGLVSIRVTRFRPAARTASLIAGALLIAAFVADRLLMTIEAMGG